MSTTTLSLRAIVFDMDGLMVDSEPLAQQIWAGILRQYGHELSPAAYARIVGRRTDFSAQLLLELYPMPLTAAELAALKHNRWTARWRQGVPAMPGLHELHATLARRAIPWAVATSSPRDYAECAAPSWFVAHPWRHCRRHRGAAGQTSARYLSAGRRATGRAANNLPGIGGFGTGGAGGCGRGNDAGCRAQRHDQRG